MTTPAVPPANHQDNYNQGIFDFVKNPRSAHFFLRKIKLERRMVDYFYERHFFKKDVFDHWIVVVKYGSRILYLSGIHLDKFSDWYYSENPAVKGGRIWKWEGREFAFRKNNRAKIR
jgi:hypothetical protein